MTAPYIADLRRMSDEELIERHDGIAKGTFVGLNYYLEELARRRSDRQMTLVVRLTWVITIATICNVSLVGWDVLS